MLQIEPARHKHIGHIARNIRQIDAAECTSFGHSPKHAMRTGLAISHEAWTALVDGRPEAMFGYSIDSALNGQGTPWFLGTDEVYRHARQLLQLGPFFVKKMRDSTPRLSNLVSVDNLQAIRLLGRWGFTVEPEEMIFSGTAFRKFRT